MSQRNKSFKIYANQMDEVAGYEADPGWLGRKLGTNRKRDNDEQQMFRLAKSFEKYLNLDISDEDIKAGIAGEYRRLDPGAQAFMVVVRSIFSSVHGGKNFGVTRGQMESLLKSMGASAQRHLGNEANSVEALTLFIGQMAQQVGGVINLEPRFQKDVQAYYEDKHKETRRDRAKQSEIKRGGLEYLGKQISKMGLEDATLTDMQQAINWVLQKAASRKTPQGDMDVASLRQLLRGMGSP